MKPIELKKLRKEFPMLTQATPLIYLDFASTGQVPLTVLDAMQAFYCEYKANIHRGVYKIGEQATEAYEAARSEVADWIGASSTETIFTSGTTDSINRIAMMVVDRLQPGDEIWVNVMEHHSNLLPWQRLAQKTGAVLRWMELKQGQIDLPSFRAALNPKAKIVAISQMSNVTGAIAPLSEICRASHRVGAWVVVDAAQSISHLPIDVRALDCDFLAFSGHKMYGPMGIGVLYGKEELLRQLEPPIRGGGMVQSVERDHAHWADLPVKFEAGTPNIPGAIGCAAAICFLKKIGMEKVRKYETHLIHDAIQRFSHIQGLRLFKANNALKQGPLFSFAHDDVHPHDLATLLDREGIAVRAGHHCAQLFMSYLGVPATTRMSIGLTTTKEEIEKAATAVSKAVELFRH